MENQLLIAHVAATIMMTTIIWFVQVVHYPLFRLVGRASFARYERAHTTRIAPLVVPLMAIEAITGLWLLIARPPWMSASQLWSGVALLIVIWLSTALLQAPAHRDLIEGYDERIVRRLLASNWVRTVAWTLRAGLVMTWLVGGLGDIT